MATDSTQNWPNYESSGQERDESAGATAKHNLPTVNLCPTKGNPRVGNTGPTSPQPDPSQVSIPATQNGVDGEVGNESGTRRRAAPREFLAGSDKKKAKKDNAQTSLASGVVRSVDELKHGRDGEKTNSQPRQTHRGPEKRNLALPLHGAGCFL